MYERLIRYAPKPAQERIREYADCVAEDVGDDATYLETLYGVKSIEELINHLVEFECGTKYTVEDPLIHDYILLSGMLGLITPRDLERWGISTEYIS